MDLESSADTMPPKPSLIDVGNRVCAQVMEKMAPKEFYRLRRTCSFMNELAKEANLMIAQRVPLVIIDHKDDIRMYIAGERSYRHSRLTDLNERLRGINLDVLKIDSVKLTPENTARLLKWLARNVKYGPKTIEWDGDCSQTVSETITNPAPREFFSILRPECLRGDLFMDKLYRWVNVIDMAKKRKWKPSPCWSIVRDFPKVEFTSTMRDIGPVLGLLMEEWNEGLDLGRCQFISSRMQPSYRNYTDEVLFGSVPAEFLYRGEISESHYAEGYKEGHHFIGLELLTTHEIRTVKVYKMINVNGESCGVAVSRTTRELYFVFTPKLEHMISLCKPIEEKK